MASSAPASPSMRQNCSTGSSMPTDCSVEVNKSPTSPLVTSRGALFAPCYMPLAFSTSSSRPAMPFPFVSATKLAVALPPAASPPTSITPASSSTDASRISFRHQTHLSSSPPGYLSLDKCRHNPSSRRTLLLLDRASRLHHS